MIIKILLLLIVIVILYLSMNTLDTFIEKVKDEDITKLESIVSKQSGELKEIIEDRKELQQDISDIAEIVYTDGTTSVSSDPTSTSTSS
jgi:hypothetical protein